MNWLSILKCVLSGVAIALFVVVLIGCVGGLLFVLAALISVWIFGLALALLIGFVALCMLFGIMYNWEIFECSSSGEKSPGFIDGLNGMFKG